MRPRAVNGRTRLQVFVTHELAHELALLLRKVLNNEVGSADEVAEPPMLPALRAVGRLVTALEEGLLHVMVQPFVERLLPNAAQTFASLTAEARATAEAYVAKHPLRSCSLPPGVRRDGADSADLQALRALQGCRLLLPGAPGGGLAAAQERNRTAAAKSRVRST
jgi:hypothetical protein